jgi:hypothetical protein
VHVQNCTGAITDTDTVTCTGSEVKVFNVNTVLSSSSATGTDSKTLYRAEASGQRTEARGLTCQFQPINVSPGQYLSPSQ